MNIKRMACALGSILLAALVPAALLGAALLVVQPVLAQTTARTEVKPVVIQGINTAAFPTITATIDVRGVTQDQLDQIRLLEDGNQQNIDFMAGDSGPLAVAILFDLSAEAQDEMGDIAGLVRDFAAQLPGDTLYALYQATAAEPRSVALPSASAGPFYADRAALLAHLATYTPDGPNDTPLLEMVQSIQSQFPANSSSRHIVVVTGPVESSGATDLGTIMAGCQNGIQVHAVLIPGNSVEAKNAGMLAGMTEVCSGANTLFGDPAAAAALGRLMVKPAGLITLVYRTQQSKPRFLKVEIPDGNDGAHFDVQAFPTLKDVRVAIEIKSPDVGSTFTSTQPISLAIEATSAPYALRIVKVEYAIDGGRLLPLAESGAIFSALLPRLDAGTHTVKVWATDELGNRNKDEVSRTLEVADPPIAPPEFPVFAIASALAAIVVAAALSALAWKWWAGRPRTQDHEVAPVFQLVLVAPLPKVPRTIVLDAETIVLGRDAAYATYILDDDRISRKQCTIQHRNGKYYVQNNSATNATLLNGQPLTKDGRAAVLKRGSVLTLGPATYQFDAMGPARDNGITVDVRHQNGPALTKEMSAAAPNAVQQPLNGQPLNGQPLPGRPLSAPPSSIPPSSIPPSAPPPVPPFSAPPSLSALPSLMQPAGGRPANGQSPAAIQNFVRQE